ncbi:MAG TPA: glycosyltransferase family 2 protein [Candidatus Fimivivens sp.]|nr:glycosyltransferase family 2 protein [Candidatus Fimivivens sp.]
MKLISIIIPAHNEEKNIGPLYEKLSEVFRMFEPKTYVFETIFVNDGSTDGTAAEVRSLEARDHSVRLIDFSRNFGKEAATSAGMHHCEGEACIMIDADMQHPAELIPDFIRKWEEGCEVVVGVRNRCKSDSFVKKAGSKLFYAIINRITDVEVVPNATDFRLLDRSVIDEFNRFTESKRMTRSLVDWLGFTRGFVYFDANERQHGTASYGFWKLFALALNSFVSLSLLPLQLAGILGITITLVSGSAGLYILLGKYVYHTPFASTFSDAENLAILIVFLVGMILMSIGLIALYIAKIHGEVINRPLYVIRKRQENVQRVESS